MWDYSEKVMDHFRHPRNVGVIEDASGIGEVGSLACGDALKLTFKLGEDDRIADAKFQTFGCASAIASSSALTEMIKGMTVDEAERVTNQDIAEFLGGLPEQKMHCSVMGREALEQAIANYRGESPSKKMLAGEVVCNCFGITEDEVRRAIRENALTSIEQITHYTKAGGGCRQCHPQLAAILEKEQANAAPPAPSADAAGRSGGRLTNLQKIRRIEEVMERDIRPQLRKDGGDIELIDVDGNRVLVALRGMCANCQVSQFTLKDVVEARLREYVTDDLVVEEQS